jgi:DNA-binding MarR family transcriptional regulator
MPGAHPEGQVPLREFTFPDMVVSIFALALSTEEFMRRRLRDKAQALPKDSAERNVLFGAVELRGQDLAMLKVIGVRGRRQDVRHELHLHKSNESMTYEAVDRLVRADLITIEKDRQDRRRQVLRPTTAGQTVQAVLAEILRSPPQVGTYGDIQPLAFKSHLDWFADLMLRAHMDWI